MKAKFFVVISGMKALKCGGVSRIIPASENWTAELSLPLNFVELQTAIIERAEEKKIFSVELTMLQKIGVIH